MFVPNLIKVGREMGALSWNYIFPMRCTAFDTQWRIIGLCTIRKYRSCSGIIQNLTLEVINTSYLITFHYDTRKYSFSVRIVNIWNSLPNSVVDVEL